MATKQNTFQITYEDAWSAGMGTIPVDRAVSAWPCVGLEAS
jgi:hypothetical protein